MDIENLTLGESPERAQVTALWNLLRREAPGVVAHDHVVVGARRWFARTYRDAIQGANVRWVVGADAPDGADAALLAAVDLHAVSRRYDELVIASGDHAFVPLAQQAKNFGLTVHVISTETFQHRSTLARSLDAAADLHTYIRRVPRRRRAARQMHRVALASGLAA